MREALAGAGAEENDFRLEGREKGEIVRAQLFESRHRPWLDSIRHHHDIRRVPLAVDHHVAFAVPGDRVDAARAGGVEFHARILQCVSFQGLSAYQLTSSTSPTS